jgi:hypothetical protein
MGNLFSWEDRVEILKKLGYKVEQVTGTTLVSRYHNEVEHKEEKIWIALKPDSEERTSYDIMQRRAYSTIYQLYGVDSVFDRELKKALTKQLFGL